MLVISNVRMTAPPLRVFAVDPKKYAGFYRSSDENALGGVCAGLAHKWGISKGGVRAGFVILTVFLLLTGIVYIILWIAAPTLPTKNVAIA